MCQALHVVLSTFSTSLITVVLKSQIMSDSITVVGMWRRNFTSAIFSDIAGNLNFT